MKIIKIKNLRVNLASLSGYRPAYTGEHEIQLYIQDKQMSVWFGSKEERNEALSQLDALFQEYAIQYSSSINNSLPYQIQEVT